MSSLALHPWQHCIPVPCLLTQELCPGLVGAERLGLLHVLGHHVEPGLGLQQAEKLRGDVVLHLPPAGSQRSGPALASGTHTPCNVSVCVPPDPSPPAVRGGEVMAVLGSVLEGSQLGHVWEVLLSRPRGRQDGEQPLEVVGEHLWGGQNAGTRLADGARCLGRGTGNDREVIPGDSGGAARPGCSGR